jgi:hypothetical protein
MKGLTGHWSKYGGNIVDVFESQHEEFLTWFCQSCKGEFNKEIKPFFYEWPEGEYIRVCGSCVHDDCILLRLRVAIEF